MAHIISFYMPRINFALRLDPFHWDFMRCSIARGIDSSPNTSRHWNDKSKEGTRNCPGEVALKLGKCLKVVAAEVEL